MNFEPGDLVMLRGDDQFGIVLDVRTRPESQFGHNVRVFFPGKRVRTFAPIWTVFPYEIEKIA